MSIVPLFHFSRCYSSVIMSYHNCSEINKTQKKRTSPSSYIHRLLGRPHTQIDTLTDIYQLNCSTVTNVYPCSLSSSIINGNNVTVLAICLPPKECNNI